MSSYVGTYSVPFTASTSFLSSSANFPARASSQKNLCQLERLIKQSKALRKRQEEARSKWVARSVALTDGEVGEELVLERAEELVVAGVRLEVHLPQIGRAVDGHLDELGGLVGLAGARDAGERVLAVRPHRRPPHHPRPAHQNTGGSKEPTSNSTPSHSHSHRPKQPLRSSRGRK